MRMNLVLELLDVPGQLLSVLKPISNLGANLVTVIHQREDKSESGRIPVQLTLEGERENLSLIIETLKEMDIYIMEIDGVFRKEKITTILSGHILDTDIRDTIEEINSLDGVELDNLELKLLQDDLRSTAKLTVNVKFGLRNAFNLKIKEIADKKNLFMISEI